MRSMLLTAAVLLTGCAPELQLTDEYGNEFRRSSKKVVKVGTSDDCPPGQSKNYQGDCEVDNYDSFDPSAQPSGIHGDPTARAMRVAGYSGVLQLGVGGDMAIATSQSGLDRMRYGDDSSMIASFAGLEASAQARGTSSAARALEIEDVQIYSVLSCSSRYCEVGDHVVFRLDNGDLYMTESVVAPGDSYEFELR